MGDNQSKPIHYSIEGTRATSLERRGTRRRGAHRGRLNGREEREAVRYTRRQGYTRRQIRIIQEVVGAPRSGTYTGLTADRMAQWQLRHQGDYGLASVDGKVDPRTKAAMVQHLAAGVSPTLAAALQGRTGEARVGERSTFIVLGQFEEKVPEWLSYEAPSTREPPSRIPVNKVLADDWAHTPLYIGHKRIYEYNADGTRTDQLTFPNGRGHYRVGDVILKGKHRANWVIRIFPELAPQEEPTSATNPEYTVGHKIVDIEPSSESEGDGRVITRRVIFFSPGERVELQETRSWTRGSLESSFSSHKRGQALTGLLAIVEPTVEVASLALGGGGRRIARRGIRKGVAAGVRRVARRSVRRLITKFYNVVSGAIGETVKTFVVELGKNLSQQRTEANLRERAPTERRAISVRAAAEKAAASAAATLIGQTLGSRLSDELAKASKDLLAVDPVLGATLGQRLKRFLTKQIVEVFTTDTMLAAMIGITDAHAQGLRTGKENWRENIDRSTLKAMKQHLKQKLKREISQFGERLVE